MDVAVYNGKLVPMTSESVAMLFNKESAFSQLAPKDTSGTINLFSHDLHTPSSIDKYSSVLDAVAPTITKKAQETFLSECTYPDATESFKTAVDKIASLECDDIVLDESVAEKSLPRDIYTIEKTGKFEYTAYLGNSEIDNRVAVPIEEAAVRDAYKTLEKCAAIREYKEFHLPSEIVSEAPIIGYDGNLTDLSLAADSKGNYIIKEGKIGVSTLPSGNFAIKMPTKAAATAPPDIPGAPVVSQAKIAAWDGNTAVTAGDFGVFVLENGVTKPTYIEKVSKINGSVEIEAFDGLEMTKLAMWRGLGSIRVDNNTKITYLPPETEFIKLGSFKENLVEFPTDTPSGDWILKTDKDSYAFGGPTFTKYAELGHTLSDVSRADAKWYMVQTGVAPEEMEKIADRKGKRHYFSSKMSCPRPFSTYVEEWNEKIAEATQYFTDNALDMVKHASMMEDGLTVDTILSLKFLNKRNVMGFIQLIPEFEKSIMLLARLLISVRIGLESIPEAAVKEAMENLTIVTAKLHELKNITKTMKK